MKLMKTINEYLHIAKLVFYVFPLLVKRQMGRMFVFREAPDWVVREVAAMKDSEHGEVNDIRFAARQESRLRELRANRERK